MQRIAYLILLCLCTISAYSQPSSPRFHRVTYGDGLSDSKVNCILKSHDGFIWIGTPMGLNRYDGYRVQSFYNKPGDSQSLPDNIILSLTEDREGMLWIETSKGYCVFNPKNDKVYRNIQAWMKSHHLTAIPKKADRYALAKKRLRKLLSAYIINDIAVDREGHFLVATDHDGLLISDANGHILQHIVNNPIDPLSIPDNTLQCIYVDDTGVVWIGMYRMGLAYHYHNQHLFPLLDFGDICTMTQSSDGSLWLGTNDSGIRRYDFRTKNLSSIHQGQDRLSSDVVVSSLAARDGSLWFGAYQGGLTRLRNGIYTSYQAGRKGLACQSVWSLAELPNGNIALGTLGGGLQILNPASGSFTTYNTHNTRLASDYIASISVMPKGWLALGHSAGISLLRIRDKKIINIGTDPQKNGVRLSSPSVNQVFTDHRGLLWIATGSGLNVYDIKNNRLYDVDLHGQRVHAEVNALCEDRQGQIWLSSGTEVHSISTLREAGNWTFISNTYSGSDGLQTRLFNKRSMLCLRDGRILVGGIDGVNIINPKEMKPQAKGSVIFSGLSLFDRPIAVGDAINGHVILSSEMNTHRSITLRHDENTFKILLAATTPGLPKATQFIYRLKGEKTWLMTSAQDPSVQFNNLTPGHYVLEVKIMGNDENNDVATLKITVLPPFYLSVWAWLIYIALAAAMIGYLVWWTKRKHQDEMEKLRLRKEKELEEERMNFFTNVSHELRTPLSLILSPLEDMTKSVHDRDILTKLKLIERNARKLLTLTNQMLDLRRIISGKEGLKLEQGDLVATVREVCSDFASLSDKGIVLTFRTTDETIPMAFDKDKIVKIVTNLLSNAFKFTPKGGRVDVRLRLGNNMVSIKVADTGCDISDEDKQHIFERFFQSKANKQGGGSGIGLNLVWEYAHLHGGTAAVSDNEGGGTVFTVSLPCKSLASESSETTPESDRDGYVTSFVSDLPTPMSESEKAVSGKIPATVMLVDDNYDFLEFLSSELTHYYNIRTASNGKEALDSIHSTRPDLVLTDIMMPVMDGNELCRQIKSDPHLNNLPVIMLTVRLSDENEIESRECGADDYIKKPFSMPLLKLRIDSLLGKNRVDVDGKVQPRISQPKITSEDEKFVDKATRYIEQHLDDSDMSVEQMSTDIGMSRVQLYRRLVSLTGKTPSEFIRLIRLRHAARLLRESQMSVSEIAYKVGFSSPRYFSRCFEELYGFKPTEYKKQG